MVPMRGLQILIEQQGISLIVTVDNGVAGNQAIASPSQAMGVDVVRPPLYAREVLPDAYAIIHPEHPDADYPSII